MKQDAIPYFLARLRRSVADRSFLLLRLRATGLPQADIRLIDLKAGPALSFATHDARQALTKNFPVEDGLAEISRRLAAPGSAWLETTARNHQLVIPPEGRARHVEHKRAAPAAPAQPRTHDREKRTRLAGAGNWLTALGLADDRGHPLPACRDKIRQIERYADLLAHFANSCGWKPGHTITLADMGCGKGYLTFAAWHLLRHDLKIDATILGLDARPELIASCQAAAQSLHAQNITFHAGKIEDAELPPLDALIALHACNDATDAALARGIAARAKLIVVAPCCHKDIRRALEETTPETPAPLAPILQHGIFKERFAEWLTDGLRVLALEAAGWRVTTAEFVAAEHTPKNLLIAAIHGNTEARRAAAARQIAAIKTWAGLRDLPIDTITSAAHNLQ